MNRSFVVIGSCQHGCRVSGGDVWTGAGLLLSSRQQVDIVLQTVRHERVQFFAEDCLHCREGERNWLKERAKIEPAAALSSNPKRIASAKIASLEM
jgi:hypothetical protein